MNIYETCPVVESERFLLRLVTEQDCEDLLKVYSDVAAVPLFNGDNCNGDDFHYTTMERMMQGIRFWIWSYENGWFVRWSIVDKALNRAIGTIELCGSDRGILRVDLRSDYEKEDVLSELLAQIVPNAFEWLGCDSLITKAKPIAQARIKVLTEMGFVPMAEPLIGHDGTEYGDYFVREFCRMCLGSMKRNKD